jgi:hypothetical protein
MSKAFAWLERVLVCLLVIGVLLELTVVSGAGLLLVVGCGLLSMLYFCGGYFQSPMPAGPVSGGSVALRIVSGIMLSTAVIGWLFYLLFLLGAQPMLWVGGVGSLIVAAVAFVLRRSQFGAAAVAPRSLLAALVSIALALTPSPTLFGIIHRDDPVLVEKFMAYQAHPNDSTLRNDYQNYSRQHSPKH